MLQPMPSWFSAQTDSVQTNAPWAVSREMMRLVAGSVPNTGMAVSIDTGDDAIFILWTRNLIGLRLAYWALQKTYGY